MAARGQNQGKEKNKLAYAPKPKIPPPPKREDPTKDSICHECGKTGHWKRNCPKYLSELLKKKKLSQGASNSDGFINRFVNNKIQVSRNNMVYYSAIPRDGIFEINLSNSYANDSSRHISKKRIEKLQHDGLLNSTDLRAFEKCVSCMSGKMARKPYTHQVKRAKDLLGLIPMPIKCIFIRYPKEMMDYSFYYPPKNKVIVARNAEFLENSLITQEASGSLEDLEIIQEEDTHPSIDTSLNHEEDNQEIDEPQSDINPIRSKWLFKKKTEIDGAAHTYKARLMAKGYTQAPWIDYEETFSPVVDIKAIRILIAIAAFYDYEISQMDVKIAFLNGYLSEEVYIEQPEGFVNPKYSN
nr:retrotransposon protein, putative, Ty1-copia subclass [Tanacetum cinerariifolium]